MKHSAALNPPTLAAAALLFAAAAALYGYAFASGRHIVKPATPIAQHLYKFPDRLGDYGLKDKLNLSKETANELGAREHFNRVYERAGDDRKITLHLSYHTGRPDARPHVSTRCYVAGGVESDEFETRTLRLAPTAGAIEVPVRLFRVPTEGDAPPSDAVIVYTHIANGRWLADPVAVSDEMHDPSVPTAWWGRIELLIPAADDLDEAATIAADFLGAAVPPIMNHMPPPEDEPAEADRRTTD